MWLAISIIGFFAAIIFVIIGVIALIARNGKAKKRFLWALVSFIAFIVGAVNLPSGATQATDSNVETASATIQTKEQRDEEAKAKKEADAKAKAEADAKAKAEAEAKAPHAGDTVSVGSLSVAVFDPKTSATVGNKYLNQTARGIYWVFPIAVRNDDKESRTVDTSMFELISNSGVKYEPDSTAGIYANTDSPFFLQKINPGIVLNGYVVFDMPKDQQIADYKMQVRGGLGFRTTKPVDITLKPRE